MRATIQKSLTTPLPALLIPILLGIGAVTAGVGAVTGIAGVALQGVAQAQATKQIEEQEDILKLQEANSVPAEAV